MFENIEVNDNVLVDSQRGNYDGYVKDISDKFITIYSYIDDRNIMLKKSDVIKINKKNERRKEVKTEVKQSAFFALEAIAQMKVISVDEAAARVVEKYAWDEVKFLQSVDATVKKVKGK